MSDIRYYTDGTPATAANLNKPLEDLEKQSQYMSQAQYESLAEMRRNAYAGSGFIGSIENTRYQSTNDTSLWTYKYDDVYYNNMLMMGRAKNNKCIANGELLTIAYTGAVDNTNRFKMPEAPTLNGTETNIKNLSKDYKQGDFVIVNDNTDSIGSLDLTTWSYHVAELENITANSYDGTGGAYGFWKDLGLIPGIQYELTVAASSTTGLEFRNSGPSGSGHFITSNDNITVKFTAVDSSLYIRNLAVGSTTINTLIIKPVVNSIYSLGSDNNINSEINKPLLRNTISRQDIVFLESWHELIDEKDIVYPLGNVQYRGDNTDDLSGITEGVFSGAETYSLFGSWQEDNTLVGLGYVWSTLSNEDKLKFASNKDNNIYMSKDGLVQVRYRVRTVKGLGDRWYGVEAETSRNTLAYDDNLYRIRAWGKRKTSDYIYNHPETVARRTDFKGSYRLWSGNSNSHITSINKDKFNITPIAKVQRRNNGAYNPYINPYGSAQFSDGNKWFNTSASNNTLLDCFNNQVKGDMLTESGREDGKLYDCINSDDVDDLRMSCDKIEDTNEYLLKTYNEFINNDIQGKENIPKLRYKKFAFKISSQYDLMINLAVASGASNCLINKNKGKFIYIKNPNDGLWKIMKIISQYSSEVYSLILDGDFGDKTGINSTWTYIETELLVPENVDFNWYDNDLYAFQNDNRIVCDIVGNPDNYPSEILNSNFLGGNPLLSNDYDVSYLPSNWSNLSSYSPGGDRIGRKIRLSKKMVGGYSNTSYSPNILKAIKYENGVYTIQDFIGNHLSFQNNLTDITASNSCNTYNELYFAEDKKDTAVWFIFYHTAANPLSEGATGSILNIGDVDANSYHTEGSPLINHTIKKVAAGGSNYRVQIPLDKTKIDWRSRTFYSDNLDQGYISHGTLDMPKNGGSATVKAFPYLSSVYSKAQMNIVFKEMKWDDGLDHITDVTTVTPASSLTMEPNKLYKFVGFDNGGLDNMVLVRRNTAWTKDFANDTSSLDSFVFVDGQLTTTDGATNDGWDIWNGNGWGDNEQFETSYSLNTQNDDNDKLVIFGKSNLRTTHFLEK